MKEQLASCNTPLYWHNCYTGGFTLWSDEAYSHPAKMSPALCYRILKHLQELGLIQEGDTVLDPMAGIGTTNICAGAMGYKSISVELEDKFVKFQEQNKEYAERRLYKPLDWQMVKGDSRKLSELMGKDGLKSVTSPPYWKPNSGEVRFSKDPRPNRAYDLDESYDTNPANISNLKDTPLKSVTSPPYSDGLSGTDKGWEKLAQDPTSNRYGRESHPSVGKEYSDNPDNIGNLKDTPLKSIVSPPYQDSQGHPSLGSVNKDAWGEEGKDIVKRRGLSGEYGDAEGQVGNLKSIVSPPYGETGVGDWQTPRAEFQEWVINELKTKGYVEWQGKKYNEAEWRAMNHGRIDGRTTKGVHKHPTAGYSEDEGNIGNLPDKPLKSIVSPPYGDAEKRDRSKEASNEKERDYPRGDHNISAGYEGSPENIGGLADKPLKSVMSPPYDKNVVDRYDRTDDNRLHKEKGIAMNYGKSEGQVAQEGQESYLQAMKKVYSEIAKVSDVLCVVVKNPTRSGKIRRLDLDTIRILELSGWRIYCQHRALLFEELEQADLFEGSKKQVKGRLSFFKRLSWQKGQPVASWEDILIAVRR